MKAKEKLFLSWDQKRVVPESNPDAAYLICNPGDKIPEDVEILLEKQQQLSEHESVSFLLWDENESLGSPGRPMVRCGHCGKESPLRPGHSDSVNPPWARVEVTAFRHQAESEFLPSIEELTAKAVMQARERTYAECVARKDQAVPKLAKVVRERTVMTAAGNVETIRRGDMLGEKKERLLRLAQDEIEQAGREADKAREAYNKLQQPRLRKIEARASELEHQPRPGYKAPPAFITDEWGNRVFADQSAALREVVGDVPTESASQPTNGKAAARRKAQTPAEELDAKTEAELRVIAETLEVKIPKGGREALIVAILKKVDYVKEAEEREKKAAAVARS